MSLYRICFSPTGGTKKIVDRVAEAWGGPGTFVDLTDNGFNGIVHELGSEDTCLIGVPSYGGRVPAVALERLATMRVRDAAAVLVTAYGNRAYDDTLLELGDAAKTCGFRVIAAVAAVAEHSIMQRFGTNRPDEDDLEELHSFGRRIAEAAGKAGAVPLEGPALPGNRPFRAYGGVPLKPKAGKACTSCGSCARSCPVGAIPQGDPVRTDRDRCISCMRCVASCPHEARTINAALLFVASRKMAKACSSRKPNELFLS